MKDRLGEDMQMTNDKVQLFEDQPIRTAWVEEEEEWYFRLWMLLELLRSKLITKKLESIGTN